MKSPILKLCFLTILSPFAIHAENLVINGDFETGKGLAFYATPPWYNRGSGLNQGANARSDIGSVLDGAYSAVVNDRYLSGEEKPGPIAHVQKTEYIIQEGDSFELTYDWRPADDFWQRSTDTIRFVLYATLDNKLGGQVVWSSELTSKFFRGKITTSMPVLELSSVVNLDAVGKNLFVMFYGVDTVNGGMDGTPHYARVDNIHLKVIDKPE